MTCRAGSPAANGEGTPKKRSPAKDGLKRPRARSARGAPAAAPSPSCAAACDVTPRRAKAARTPLAIKPLRMSSPCFASRRDAEFDAAPPVDGRTPQVTAVRQLRYGELRT